jgi:hypothetical protein
MSRDLLVKIGLGLAAIGLAVWIARNTYWDDVQRHLPMKGEALEDPYYSLRHSSGSVGIETQEITSLRTLPPQAVLLIDDLQDDLLREPLSSVQGWVESGGRLVLSSQALRANAAIQTWIAVKPETTKLDKGAPAPRAPAPALRAAPGARPKAQAPFWDLANDPDTNCTPMTERINGIPAAAPLRACIPGRPEHFVYDGDHAPRWSLSDDAGIHAVRTSVGLGEVTVVGSSWWVWSNLMLPRGDNAEIFIHGAGLRRGDRLLILTHSRAEPLIALLWRLVAPAILFLLAAVLLLIWRNLPRFGPPVPAGLPARRSLAEQLRANARFALRTRELGALRTAAGRALDEAAARSIAGYARLDAPSRARELAARTGIDGTAVAAALAGGVPGNTNEQRAAITLMEVCRRMLDTQRKGPSHDR